MAIDTGEILLGYARSKLKPFYKSLKMKGAGNCMALTLSAEQQAKLNKEDISNFCWKVCAMRKNCVVSWGRIHGRTEAGHLADAVW